MKKTLPIIAICATLLIVIPLVAGAAGITLENPLKCKNAKGEDCDLLDIIDKITGFLAGLASTVAVIMIIWAGIVYMTAGDNEEKIKSAKKTILWALIGLAIVWSSHWLTGVIEWLTGP